MATVGQWQFVVDVDASLAYCSVVKMRKERQGSFGFVRRGGKRRGAGRKPKVAGRPGVTHARRVGLSGREPVHVTLRVRDDVPNLRRWSLLDLLMDALRDGRERDGFRLCHFVIMGNHLHLICEGRDARALGRGIQGLTIRLAKRVNARLGRTGRFFADRYHAHVLKTPTEVHRALSYVLNNLRKHVAEQGGPAPTGVDTFSSGAWFEASPAAARLRAEREPPVAAPTVWLLTDGWKRVGPIAL